MAREYFDKFAATEFVNGSIAGIAAFRAMLDDSKADDANHTMRVLKILVESVNTAHGAQPDSSQKSAAIKLLELVIDSLEFRARQSDCQAWLDVKQSEAEKFRQVVARLESRKNSHMETRFRQARQDHRFQSFVATLAGN